MDEGLQRERVKPTPEIKAKAAELTKGAADDQQSCVLSMTT